MKKICFVCSGNECRSPMAEKIFNDLLKKENIKDIKASSAGVDTLPDQEMTLKAKRALKKLGINVGRTKSKQLKSIKSDTIYIAMTEFEKKHLNQQNVLSFKDIVGGEDVADPYGKDQDQYDKTAYQLQLYCGLLLQKLKKM